MDRWSTLYILPFIFDILLLTSFHRITRELLLQCPRTSTTLPSHVANKTEVYRGI
ncbi:Uncharacterized protein APZ42_011777 [Daphnia magna]|uniref:Uncharacterized protein n=1 Tax=Daphnia magna TaxID=35525 RepID=A0A162T067_9CRUS|nr:Uncharacterized protein APZ42_011777 [Daphnia magna]